MNLNTYWVVFYHNKIELVASDQLEAGGSSPHVCLKKQTLSFSISGNTSSFLGRPENEKVSYWPQAEFGEKEGK